MREIKFRQYLKPHFHKNGEVFHYWGFIDGGFISPMGKNEAEGESEQFTGLKDRNGNEIYEGDVVNVSDGGEWWLDGIDAATVCFDGIGWYPWTMVSAQIDCDYITSRDPKDIKIIGNVHQNHELLEANK